MKARRRLIRLAAPARRDLAAIARWTVKEFGEDAWVRYETLIAQALEDLAAEPERPGSREVPEVGVRVYHLASSRERVVGPRVRQPRHVLVYRVREEGVVEIARVIHDARDLARHLPVGMT